MGGRESIPDGAWVIRCGRPPFDQPKPLHDRCEDHDGVYGFSVQSRDDRTIEELAAWCSNNTIGVMTAGEIRRRGYDVVVTSGQGYHATVVVPRDWDPVSAQELAAAFRGRANPIPKAMRLR